jgi:hypothetical protein
MTSVAQCFHVCAPVSQDEMTRLQFETDLMKDERAELEEEVGNYFMV